MPITYESPAPVAAAASVYAQQAANERARQNQLAAAHAAGGGYGGGHSGVTSGSIYGSDADFQAAIFARDNMQFAREKDALDRTTVPQSEIFRQQAESSRQQQSYELQAQLHDVELSQAEKMRLQRLKNQIGEVSADPSLADAEKADLIVQLKTGIDPLQRRMAQEKIQQEKILKESMAEQKTAIAAFEKNRLDISAKSVDDRSSFSADPTSLMRITADYKANIGPQLEMAYGPEAAAQMIAKMAKDEALKQGLGTHVYMQPDGKLVPYDGHAGGLGHEGEGTPGKAGAGAPKSLHPTGLTPQDYLKAREHIEGQLQREAAQTQPDTENGGKKPVYPKLQTPEGQHERLNELLDRAKIPRDFEAYNAGLKAPEAKGYKSPFDKAKAAAAAVVPQPGEAPAGTPAATVSAINSTAQTEANRILNRTDLTPEVRNQGAEAVGTIRRFMVKSGGNPDKLSADDRVKFDAAKKFIDDNVPEVKTPVAAAAGAPPAGGPGWARRNIVSPIMSGNPLDRDLGRGVVSGLSE